MKPFKIVTQLDAAEGKKTKTFADDWVDDCAPSSLAAATNYLRGTAYTSKDGIAWATTAGRVDRDGSGDPTTHEHMKKMAPMAGLALRYAKSWAEVESALKNPDEALLVSVQQPKGYPERVLSAWAKAHKKRTSGKVYGHCTAAAGHEMGAQWADPTMTGKGKEALAVPVTIEEFKQICKSQYPSAPHKAIRILKSVAKKPVQPDLPPVEPRKVEKGDATPVILETPAVEPVKINYGKTLIDTVALAESAIVVTKGAKGMLNKIKSAIDYVVLNSKLDEMLLDAVRTFLTVSISVALGLGIPILDISGGDFRVIISAGLASALNVIVRALNPDDKAYGLSK